MTGQVHSMILLASSSELMLIRLSAYKNQRLAF